MLSFMAVMAREAWTDERLDDLKENVNQRFDQVDKRFDQVDERFNKVDERFNKVEAELKAGFERVDNEFTKVRSEMKAGFAEVNGRIDSRFDLLQGRIDGLSRTIIICFSGMTASIVGAILVTQL